MAWQWTVATAAAGWLLYAVWEWVVGEQSPDADIRIDLLLIYPILAILSLAAIITIVRRLTTAGSARL